MDRKYKAVVTVKNVFIGIGALCVAAGCMINVPDSKPFSFFAAVYASIALVAVISCAAITLCDGWIESKEKQEQLLRRRSRRREMYLRKWREVENDDRS